MLELRPSCENCGKLLPPSSVEARICSFECTFCATCVEEVLKNVCPNCGGGFERRPVRPQRNWKGGNYLGRYPATSEITDAPVNLDDQAALVAKVAAIPPQDR